jgi:signal transduction histidine kinase
VRRSCGAAAEKGQTIHFDANCEGLVLEGDQRRWLQILLNLLSNAIKFTPQDGELGVMVERDEAASLVQIHMWDRGIGISPDGVARLFRPFSQLDSALTRQFPGTGLGLALTKRLIELQGGRISVHSELGHGSIFTITKPYAQ